MARLKNEQIRNMTGPEIEQNLHTLYEELYKLRIEAKSGRVEKPHRMRETKRNIARYYTILRERKSEQP